MVKRKKKNFKKGLKKKKRVHLFLPAKIKKYILGVISSLLALIFVFSFFGKAGIAGKILLKLSTFFIGKVVFLLPTILFLTGLVFFTSHYQKFLKGTILAIFLLILGSSGILGILYQTKEGGGVLGYYLFSPLLKLFGFWVSELISMGIVISGLLIFYHLLKRPEISTPEKITPKPSLIKRIFPPKFKVKKIETSPTLEKEKKIPKEKPSLELKPKPIFSLQPKVAGIKYPMPPLDLLEADKGEPKVGDIQMNSAIIKRTLENFDIPVEMSEINIGPTVTQYTLKPAEGIKLSKITTLSNNLSLALAAHPIRIEAPIPGKSLVGIEVPNKVRSLVRLRDLIANPKFQQSLSNLTFCLGRDVAGQPVYADLAQMPHLLVAGSTGSGKTVQLNTLIISLLYQNSPQSLRFILVDPKRVEFTIYQNLPHLLCPVIFDAQKTVNTLKWLISEMERRFDLFSEVKSRDIVSYNEMAIREKKELLPYIVLVIDELADLMAARGREMEAGIVRLAQMARAVGIHLVLATQRPSVEVITGLIKANITSRIAFQVASQVDSRTILDVAGAEKLLGRGDMLFVSSEFIKPKRIQGAFVSEGEIKKIVSYLQSKIKGEGKSFENVLSQDLETALEVEEKEIKLPSLEEDPLYEEAKRVVIEAKKASASLLQRRLKIGYARAARLIDMLEERGVVGPANGAKPREVYLKEEEGWKKI